MYIPWKRLAQAAVLALALGFLFALIRSQWSALSDYHWRLTPAWAVLAVLGLELSWLLELSTWRVILAGLGGRLSYWRAAQVWFLSNIIRYIPGNVWQFVGMAEMAAEDGVPRIATFSSIMLHQVISTAAGIVLVALYFGLAGQRYGAWFELLRPALWLVPLGLVLLQPRLLERVLNFVLIRLRRQPLQISLTWGQVWLLLLRYVLVWLCMGLSFVALVRAVVPVQLVDIPYLVVSWASAYVIGYLSLLTPSGLGVREAVMAALLSAIRPAAVAAVIAIVARLWMVAAELLGAGCALAFRGRQPDARRRLGQQAAGVAPAEPVATVAAVVPASGSAGITDLARRSPVDGDAYGDA